MIGLIRRIWSITKKVLKFVGGIGRPENIPAWVYQAIHFFLVGLTAVLLAVFSAKVVQPASVQGSPFVQDYYLAIMFLLAYVFIRLLLYEVDLFRRDEAVEFPEIYEAWERGVRELTARKLESVPWYFVVGLPAHKEQSFFRSGKFFRDERDATTLSDSATLVVDARPIRFWANDTAVFVCCSGVSATTRQSLPPQPGTEGAGIDLGQQTMNPGQGGGGPGMTAGMEPEQFPLSQSEMDNLERRFRFLSRLVVRHHGGRCPAGGVLLCVPLRWVNVTNPQVLLTVKQDIRLVMEGLQVSAPVTLLFTGVERLYGFRELLEFAPSAGLNKESRAGASYPVGALIDEHTSNWIANAAADWFRRWVYVIFSMNIGSSANPPLFLMLCQIDRMREGMANLVRSTLGGQVDGAGVRLAGCYFCGTRDFDSGERRQGLSPDELPLAFLPGVLAKVMQERENTSFSPNRLIGDQSARAWGYVLLAAIGLLVLGNIWLIADCLDVDFPDRSSIPSMLRS